MSTDRECWITGELHDIELDPPCSYCTIEALRTEVARLTAELESDIETALSSDPGADGEDSAWNKRLWKETSGPC